MAQVSDDGTNQFGAQNLVVTITGTNDAPVVTADDVTGDIEEGVTLMDSGSIDYDDLDANGTITASLNTGDEAPAAIWSGGTLTDDQETALFAAFSFEQSAVDNNGTVTWEYNVAETVLDFLADDETATLTFTLDFTDDQNAVTQQVVTINIEGTNDAPVIDAVGPHAILDTEEADMIEDITGTLTETDLDVSDMHTFSIGDGTDLIGAEEQTSDFGTLTVNADGTYSFAVNNEAVDALDVDETPTVTFDVQVSDGITTDTTTLEFNITGVNDNPIANDDTIFVDEDAIVTFNPVFGGSTETADTDAEGHMLTIIRGDDIGSSAGAAVVGGAPAVFTTDFGGVVTLEADGSASYNLTGNTGAFLSLGAGDVGFDEFTYTISDGNGGEATATVTVETVSYTHLTLPTTPYV